MSLAQIKTAGTELSPEWLEVVRRQVASLRFGTVQIVIHDSQVKQIEKTERLRFDKAADDHA